MLLLHNPVKDYAWGPVDGIADLVGTEPTGGHEAELWVGTHPSAPSVVVGDPDGRTLADVIAADPMRSLGPELSGDGHTALPFLLKVLAIGAPLSLQAHPTRAQAEAGFAKEEAAGLASDAPSRIYRDRSPKPEAMVALTDTWALCGFREPQRAAELVALLAVPALEPLHATLAGGGDAAMRTALAWLLGLPGDDRHTIATAVGAAARHADPGDRGDPIGWVRSLTEQHESDPTCLAPLLMELVHLAPGEAVHLPAGNLHAYLSGAGVEIMAASDNVLRGGLTPKHVAASELLAILSFEPGVPPGPVRTDGGDGITTYDAGEEAFALTLVEPGGGRVDIEPAAPSLLLATGGAVDVAGAGGDHVLDHGAALFVAPGSGPLTVAGGGRLWWATVGNGLPT